MASIYSAHPWQVFVGKLLAHFAGILRSNCNESYDMQGLNAFAEQQIVNPVQIGIVFEQIHHGTGRLQIIVKPLFHLKKHAEPRGNVYCFG